MPSGVTNRILLQSDNNIFTKSVTNRLFLLSDNLQCSQTQTESKTNQATQDIRKEKQKCSKKGTVYYEPHTQ